MWIKRIAPIAVLMSSWILLPSVCPADRIVLKDGSVEESDKIWLSDKFLHFILKGTQSVEIRYAIEIVDRVEKDGSKQQAATDTPELMQPKSLVGTSPRPLPGNDAAAMTAGAGQTKLKDSAGFLRMLERESKGVSFYDPRRSSRYRVSPTSAHNDLKSALKELADIYGRTPEWVAAHMGEENDIQRIHRNLIGRHQAENSSQKTALPGNSPSARDGDIARSPGKKMTGPGAPSSYGVRRKTVAYPELDFDNNTKFYDPRRPEKYWTGKSMRHNSLHDALDSLARLYNVAPKWIEDHMGESNLLFEIHTRIRNRLPQD